MVHIAHPDFKTYFKSGNVSLIKKYSLTYSELLALRQRLLPGWGVSPESVEANKVAEICMTNIVTKSNTMLVMANFDARSYSQWNDLLVDLALENVLENGDFSSNPFETGQEMLPVGMSSMMPI